MQAGQVSPGSAEADVNLLDHCGLSASLIAARGLADINSIPTGGASRGPGVTESSLEACWAAVGRCVSAIAHRFSIFFEPVRAT